MKYKINSSTLVKKDITNIFSYYNFYHNYIMFLNYENIINKHQ